MIKGRKDQPPAEKNSENTGTEGAETHLEPRRGWANEILNSEISAPLGDAGVNALIELRIGVGSYRRYKVNKFELWILRALVGYCRYRGRDIVSLDDFIENCTKHWKMRAKIQGGLLGLSRKGMMQAWEYKNTPGSVSISLSDLGRKCYQEFEAERAKLGDRYGRTVVRGDKERRGYWERDFYEAVSARRAQFMAKIAAKTLKNRAARGG